VTGGPAIAVEGLVKRYGARTVVDGVSLQVPAGELAALLGPNGAGKTTTVETVEGYRRPDGGAVRVLGMDPLAGGRALRARIGLMLQGGGFDPRSRTRETLVEFAGYHEDPRDPDELLAMLGLATVARTPFRRLSGGERQRLALAVALVGRPEVLLLDEPTAGLDPEARVVVREIVAEARAGGAAILLTSHDLTDVERLADRIVVIDRGRVVASGSPAELTAGVGSAIRFRVGRPLETAQAETIQRRLHDVDGLLDATLVADGGSGRYRLDGVAAVTPAAVAALAAGAAEAGLTIVELRAGGGTLEEAYFALLERADTP
jgi:ABC-2 type transport system ATP-binding protein